MENKTTSTKPVYTLSTRIKFGKYKDRLVSDILKLDPKYLKWAWVEKRMFIPDKNVAERLRLTQSDFAVAGMKGLTQEIKINNPILNKPISNDEYPIKINNNNDRYNFLYRYYKPSWDKNQDSWPFLNEYNSLSEYISSLNYNNSPYGMGMIFKMKFPFYILLDHNKNIRFKKSPDNIDRPLSLIFDDIKKLSKEQKKELRQILKDKFNIQENMKKSEFYNLVKEVIKNYGKEAPITIPKPTTTEPEVKPKRRTLQPPKEAPNTKPKAQNEIQNKIKGGLADGKTLADLENKYGVSIDEIKKELKRGIKVELEHTSDPKTAAEIAMDHLWEDLKYYEKLASIEESKENNIISKIQKRFDGLTEIKK